MGANTTPIYPLMPKIGWGTLTATTTAMDGTGNVAEVFTAGINGARIDQIKIRALGTNVATAVRLYLNNGGERTVPANNSLIYEVTAAATTASPAAALNDIVISPPVQFLPPGYKLMASIGTAVEAGIQITVAGADY
ncbi:MAG TPA: hypothetical protein VN608_09450 [Clostridia bacterium]|nr:hypothetical protein [Clostridia bacterium]